MDQPTFSLVGSEDNINKELTFVWAIPNFKKRLEVADKSPDASAKKFVSAEFFAGEKSNDLTPKWEFFLIIVGDEPNKTLDIGLEFFGPGSCPAKCDIYFRSPAGKLFSASTLEKQEYTEGSIGSCRIVRDNFQNISRNDFSPEEFCPNGQLILQLNVTIQNRTPDGMQSKMDILKVFKNGLNSKVGSDVIFVFEEEGSGNIIEEIRAHKAILSFHSPVFAEMFGNGNMQTEGTPTRVKISEMSPQGMKLLLQFLYSGETDEEWKSVVEELIHATQKYQMAEMQKFLRENIAFALTVKNCINIRNWGEQCGLPEVVEAATKFMKDNFEEFLRLHNLTSKDNLPKTD